MRNVISLVIGGAVLFSSNVSMAFFPMTCLKAEVKIREQTRDEYFCWTDGNSDISNTPTGSPVIIPIGPSATSTQGLTNGPKPPTVKQESLVKCGADMYGTKYPHVSGYSESFIPGYGYENSEDGSIYVLPKQNPIHPYMDTALEGDTSESLKVTFLYKYGWSSGPPAYNGEWLTNTEQGILTLVHERGHQNGVHDDVEGGLNDQAGMDAVHKYRADNGSKCAQFK